MKTLTEAQKRQRKMNRERYWQEHLKLVDAGDKYSSNNPSLAREYYQRAQDAYTSYKANGGRQ